MAHILKTTIMISRPNCYALGKLPKVPNCCLQMKRGGKTATLTECVLPKIPFYLKCARVCVSPMFEIILSGWENHKASINKWDSRDKPMKASCALPQVFVKWSHFVFAFGREAPAAGPPQVQAQLQPCSVYLLPLMF